MDRLSSFVGQLSKNKSSLPVLIAFALGFVMLFAPKPTISKKGHSILYSNPKAARAVSGFFAPIAADALWLRSTHVGEIGKSGSFLVDSDEFANAFMTIGMLDPNFFAAISYGCMYLSSIAGKPDKAIEIIDACLKRVKDDRLKFLKLNILHTYKNDQATSIRLAKELLASEYKFDPSIPAFSYDYLVSLMAFGATSGSKKAAVIEDLKLLEKQTKNPAQKNAIKAKLDALL